MDNENTPFEQEQQRLKSVVDTSTVITYFEENDLEQQGLVWTVYGVIETNEIIVRGSAGKAVYYGMAESPVIYPPMAERVLGIDYADEAVAAELANAIWRVHKAVFKGELGASQ